MRFLGGLLKFLAVLLLIAATLGCTAVAMMAEQMEAYIVMGCAWAFAFLVVLNIWGTGMALSNAAKNKKKIAQLEQKLAHMEQKLLDMNFSLSKTQAQLQVYASRPVAPAPAAPAEGETAETQSEVQAEPAAQPMEIPVAAPVTPAAPAAPVKKSGNWIPAVIAGVLVVAVVAVVAVVVLPTMSDPTPGTNPGLNPGTNPGQNSGFQPGEPSQPTEPAAQPGIPLSVGDSIDNELFTMTFDSVEIVDEFKYKTSDISSTSLFVEDGYKLLIVRGTFTNNAMESISTSDMVFSAVVNGSYKTDSGDVRLNFMRSNSYEADPFTEVDYVLHVNIPEKLAGMFESAEFHIYFNSDLSFPTTIWDMDGNTTIEADTHYTLSTGLTKDPVAPGEEGKSEADEMASKSLPISIGDVIDAGDFEFTLLDVELTYELLPPNTSSVYTSYPAESGKVYVHVEADVKNTMQRDLRISELFKTTVIYNGKYPYTGFPIVNDGDNRFDWVSSYVAATPLETCRAHGLVECPVEVDESDNSLIVYIEMGGQTYQYVIR